MPVIRIETRIHAAIETCFDLARSIDLHASSMSHTQERAVAGVTRGLIGLNEEVTWEAIHFGIRQRLTSRITVFDRPHHFRDSMVRGAFRSIEHDHLFRNDAGVTTMTDVFAFESPLGILGRIANRCLLERYMRSLLLHRTAVIRQAAESSPP